MTLIVKPCDFKDGACTHCNATEQDDCEGWVPPAQEILADAIVALEVELASRATYIRELEDANTPEIVALKAERDALRAALTEYDALIRYQYTGSHEAMHALTKAAKNGAAVLEQGGASMTIKPCDFKDGQHD